MLKQAHLISTRDVPQFTAQTLDQLTDSLAFLQGWFRGFRPKPRSNHRFNCFPAGTLPRFTAQTLDQTTGHLLSYRDGSAVYGENP